MPIYLRQSTASQEVPLGHFVDSTDGVTAETALTIANTDIKVWVTGATTLANKNSGGATHISGGVYYCVLDATDTATIGPLVLFVAVAGALAVRLECVVLDETVYDVMFGTTAPSTLGGMAQTGDAYAVVNHGTYGNAQLVRSTTPANTLSVDAAHKVPATVAAGDVATDAITGAAVKADAVTKIQAGLATPTNITAGTVTTVSGNVGGIIQGGGGGVFLGVGVWAAGDSGVILAPASTALSTAVWTATIAGRIDAAVSSRMATYAQPTGFLAVTFPAGTVASTTNITAGTITTVTNLTNAPTAGDFTAAMKVSLNAASVDVASAAGSGLTPTGGANFAAVFNNGDVVSALQLDGLATAAAVAAVQTTANAVNAKTTNLPGSPAAVGSAMTLTSGERDSIAAAYLDLANGVETGLTPRQALRLLAAALAGKVSGAETTTVTIRNAVADGKNRLVATVDSDGNRSAVVYDLT